MGIKWAPPKKTFLGFTKTQGKYTPCIELYVTNKCVYFVKQISSVTEHHIEMEPLVCLNSCLVREACLTIAMIQTLCAIVCGTLALVHLGKHAWYVTECISL
jgi:hypothetical protein